MLFNRTELGCPRLVQFINCTPTFRSLDEVHLLPCPVPPWHCVTLRSRTSKFTFNSISFRDPDGTISFIKQVRDSLHSLFMVENLYIKRNDSYLCSNLEAVENSVWLELLRPFTAVKNLYLPKEFAPAIVATLLKLDGTRIAEVLPACKIFLLRVSRDGSPTAISRFPSGPKTKVNVMQLVSYSPSSLGFTFTLYHSSRKRRACCCSTRLASCLLQLPLPHTLSSIVHCAMDVCGLPMSSYTLYIVIWFISMGVSFRNRYYG